MKTHPEFVGKPLSLYCWHVQMFMQSPVTSRRLFQMGDKWCLPPSIGIEVWVEHPDVDGHIDASGGPVISLVKDLNSPYVDLVSWSPNKV